MKQKGKIILSSVLTALSVLTTLGLCAVRVGFVFVDHYVFDGFCYILWALFIVNTVILFFQLRGSILDNKLFNKICLIINGVLLLLNIACIAAFLIIGKDDLMDYLYVSFETLPYLTAFYALLFFTVILPISHKTVRKITACAVCAAIVISVLAVFPIGSFNFEAAPAVFDTGDGYHIVFATNKDSVGYVKLGDQVIWDTYAGRKEASRIHSIEVSYEALNNNEYSIGAMRAIEDIAYGGHLGKEITLEAGTFTPCPEDDFDMTCITDNHSCRPDWEKIGVDADIYVFLGDISSGVYAINSIIDNLIAPAGKVSGGVKPVIYTLGNHDHRGSKVQDLLQALDFGEYYYRLSVGKYNFTVLDSGEDKEDENYEYAGYNAFAPYFAEQIEWGKTLQKESGYNVIITHSPSIYFEPEGHPGPMAEIMRNLGEEFVICGHHHSAEFVSAQESITGIATYICGAKTDSNEIVYTRMHFNGGAIDITSQNTQGEIINTQQFQLTLAE